MSAASSASLRQADIDYLAFPVSQADQRPIRALRVLSAASRPATTTRPANGCSASKPTSAPPTSMARSAGPEPRHAPRELRGQDELDGHRNGPRRLCLLGPHAVLRQGGGAFTNTTVNVRLSAGPAMALPPLLLQSGSPRHRLRHPSTRAGWTIGFGTEFDLRQELVGQGRVQLLSTSAATPHRHRRHDDLGTARDIAQVKVGVNYRFAAPDGGRRQVLSRRVGPGPDREFSGDRTGGRPISFTLP